ncbi:MAG: Do family serine endopeptidase [Bacteroidia bacterium]
MKRAIAILMIAGFGGISGAYLYSHFNGGDFRTYKNVSEKQQVHFTSMPNSVDNTLPDFTNAADLTVHAVVHVKTYYNGQTSYNPFSNPFDFWMRPQQSQPQQASGSGVIITDDGYIVTNNHVVENADKVEVTLNDNKTYPAKVIGTDPSTDLALLKIAEHNLPFVMYGNSDNLKVGEWVLAVGNPFNLTSTVTAGIVSAKARNIGILPDQYKIESFIQTDAAVNPGNSGGALVNTQGQLVGINSAIASNTGSFTGYSFAIPSNLVRKVIDDLVEFGSVQRGFIGVSIRDIDSKLMDEKGIKESQGVYVAGITPGGAADDAGLREGDVITRVGSVSVNSTPQLQEQVGRFRPGDKVSVGVIRDGKSQDFTLTLRNKDGDTKIVKNDEPLSILGGTFENASQDDRQKLGIRGGVRISKLTNGKLRSAGIREGFIITSIDKKQIQNTDDLESALKTKQGGVLIEGIYPNGMKAYYGFGI